MYSGKIERCSIKKKRKTNIKALLLWYLGIVISFLPIFLDMMVFLSEHDQVTKEYWIRACLKGDILWILATIIVLTVIDYFGDERKKSGYRLLLAIIGIVIWGIVFAVWAIFKYVYAADYEKDLPVVITLIATGITLTCCSPLQVKIMEVKG